MYSTFIASCIAAIAMAVTDNVDGTSGAAPCIDPYLAVCGECNAEIGVDPHTVHGFEANDGGLVAVGQLIEAAGTYYDGFVIKTKGSCTYTATNVFLSQEGSGCDDWDWVTKIATDNSLTEQALWVAESPDFSYYIAVGMRQTSGGKAIIFVTKLQSSDGTIVWTMDFANPADASLNASAETVAFLSDGSFVVGGGVNSSIAVGDMHFKSGGNVEESSAWMGQISASDAAGSTAPTSFAWQWTTTDGRQGNVKAIRVDSSDNIIGVAGIGSQATAYKLNSSGTEQWNTGTAYNGSQFSDLTINADGTMAFAGLAAVGNTYYGRLIGADSTGTQTFSVDYGNYGGGVNSYDGLTAADGDWIYNECWGIAKTYATDGTTHDGYILACGTGIECENGSANVSQCTTDYRKNWRALLVATDLSGNRVWSRMDNVSLGDGVAT